MKLPISWQPKARLRCRQQKSILSAETYGISVGVTTVCVSGVILAIINFVLIVVADSVCFCLRFIPINQDVSTLLF